MKWLKFLYILIGLIFSFYLVIPGSEFPPPDLPDSLKSDLPGDTVQIPNVSAYFTDKEREDVVGFFKDYYSRSTFFNIPLPVIRINHPPEYAKQIIKDTMQTYYLEELIHPFKDSVYINGFEWENDVFTPEASREKNIILIGDKVWKSKVTLKWFPQNRLISVASFVVCWFLFWFVVKFWLIELKDGVVRLFKKK